MKKVFVFFLFVIASCVIYAQQKSEIKIKTFFHCGNGKALIEKELPKVEGIYSTVADLETKVVTIHYDETKLNKESIITAIEKIGYYTEFSDKNKKIRKACSHDDHRN